MNEIEKGLAAVVEMMEIVYRMSRQAGLMTDAQVERMRREIAEVEALGLGPLATGFMIGVALAAKPDDAQKTVIALGILREKDEEA